MTEIISPELRSILRRLKLGPILATLPERLALARQQELSIAAFLETVLADEVARRDRKSGDVRARSAGLDPEMRLEAWDEETDVRFDRRLWGDLCALRFLDDAHNVLILGPVGVGKTMLADCLGHIACRRRRSVLFFRTERMLKLLKAARLDASYDAELRRLIAVDLLVLDDFALQAYDHQETADLYELVVERHRRASTVVASNREPKEWLAMMADPLLAQSAVDRLLNAAYELVLEGDSYRRHQKPGAPREGGPEAPRGPQRAGAATSATLAAPPRSDVEALDAEGAGNDLVQSPGRAQQRGRGSRHSERRRGRRPGSASPHPISATSALTTGATSSMKRSSRRGTRGWSLLSERGRSLPAEKRQSLLTGSQPAARAAIFSDRRAKLADLARDRQKHCISPIGLLIVIPRGDNFTVLEGNRRVLVLKTLHDPALAVDTSLEDVFKKLAASKSIELPTDMEAAVFRPRHTARHWIQLMTSKRGRRRDWLGRRSAGTI